MYQGRLRRYGSIEPSVAIWPLHDISLAYIVWCLAHTRGVGREPYTINRGILLVAKIQGGEVKEAFRAKNRID